MNYDAIILELMGRIKELESCKEELEQRIIKVENVIVAGGERKIFSLEEEKEESKKRIKMTKEMIDICYEKGKEAWRQERHTTKDLRAYAIQVSEETGMNKSSAHMYIYAVVSMLEGTIYKRAISQPATEQYLGSILKEYGPDMGRKALSAVRLHVEYMQRQGMAVYGIKALCDKFEKQI